MYFAVVILLLLIFPAASVIVEDVVSRHAVSILPLIGRWFVFWAVGIRLFIAGARQVVQPRFTAEEIFGIRDRASFVIVRELGFANLSMGLLGICSVFRAGWIVPAAIVGGLYYGLAGVGHIFQNRKNAKEYTAMISDSFVFLVLTVFVLNSFAT
jgi:fatty acid desaturase